ncbi:PREDICTED: uncharacterized protein LOC104761711 [Camelina sativa]|uniref:Uncharacterized protein LOC104761711 n=1 Tax=Camelina sativa TaxID=90675 RepID=A0ABM0XAM3_CAMSA|nr:PREDICTED: uncharacterized protein LOC104761711 [Camelina sativa]
MKEHIFCQFLVVMMLLSASQIQGERCHDSGIEGLRACAYSIYKRLPTPPRPYEDCCTQVRLAGMQCVCEAISTKVIEDAIDIKKLVNVAAVCGRPLAPGSQCGRFLVPGGMMRHHD